MLLPKYLINDSLVFLISQLSEIPSRQRAAASAAQPHGSTLDKLI